MIYCNAKLSRYEAHEWITYSYMKQTSDGNLKFKDWILSQDWSEVYCAVDSNEKAKCYQDLINGAMNDCFLVITVKRKSSEHPWINDKIRKKIALRKRIFKKEGRSKTWKKIKKTTKRMIKFH